MFLSILVYSLVNLIIITIWFYLSFVRVFTFLTLNHSSKLFQKDSLLPLFLFFFLLPFFSSYHYQVYSFAFSFLESQYYQARGYMLKHCLSIFAIPFYHVQFPDFFLGDQLTSHNQTVVDFSHLLCLFISGSFLTESVYK